LREQRGTILLIALIVLVVGVLVGLTWANYRFSLQNPGGNDFLARWMGARYWVVEGISPYDQRVSLATQQMIYGHPADISKGEDKNHFVYPLYSMIFFAPFGPLEYPVARALWMTLIEICLFLLAIVSVRLADWQISSLKMAALILFTLFWYHGVRTVIIGQFAGINAMLIAVGLLLIMRRQDFAGGMLLAVTSAKPQMVFLLLPFVLLWALSTHRRDVIGGMLIGLLVLLVASLALLPSWPLQWLQQLFDYPSYTSRIGSPISVIAGYMPGISRQLSIFLHVVTLGYLVLEWIFAWGKDENWFRWTALLTLVITNLVAYRTATTNFMMMLPALFLVFSLWEVRWRAIGRIAVWVSLFVLGFGSWALFLSTVRGNEEQAVMYLVFPLLCLIGLWWGRWWAIHPPHELLRDMAERVEV
jgi:hypothetical protein